MCCGEESAQAQTFQTSPTPHPPPVAFPCLLEIFYDSGTTSPIRFRSEKMTGIIHLETLSIVRHGKRSWIVDRFQNGLRRGDKPPAQVL